MSYCRWIEGDVYVYATWNGDGRTRERWFPCKETSVIICMCCPSVSPPGTKDIKEMKDFVACTRSMMVTHLEEHIARGESVGHAIERLKHEIEAEGDEIRGDE